MNRFFNIKSGVFSVSLVFLFFVSMNLSAQDGKAIFQQKCATCHAVDKNLTGPALKGVEDRWPDKNQIYNWIHNSASVIKSGYPHAVEIYAQYNKIQMPAFPELTNKDIDAILGYINTASVPAPVPSGDMSSGSDATSKGETDDSSLLFGILTMLLAVVMLILLQVNSNLKKLSDICLVEIRTACGCIIFIGDHPLVCCEEYLTGLGQNRYVIDLV